MKYIHFAYILEMHWYWYFKIRWVFTLYHISGFILRFAKKG